MKSLLSLNCVFSYSIRILKSHKSREVLVNKKNKQPWIEVYYKPGLSMNEAELDDFTGKIKKTAQFCFTSLPDYQVMRGTREELSDKVIAVAWSDSDRSQVDGFCSSVLLPVERIGEVLHLGLTCVRPEARSRGLTHVLTHKAVASQLLRTSPLIGKLWISNCAAVLSSLVNVAVYFENVYPSPFHRSRKTNEHVMISDAINRYHRDKMYINREAEFDPDDFIFRGSVNGTVFQKDSSDCTYHHRNKILNRYYQHLMDFNRGDEILQIGYASTFAAIRHMLRINNRRIHPSYLEVPVHTRGRMAQTA